MNGHEAVGAGSSPSSWPEGRDTRSLDRNDVSLDENDVPFWAMGEPEGGRPEGDRRGTEPEAPREMKPSGRPPLSPVPPPTGDAGDVTMGRRKVSHIARDSSVPAWRRRIIIAVVAGIAVTIWLNWRFGLTMAVLVGIADAVISARTSAANTAAGLVTGAQRATKKQLSQMERGGYRALHIRAIPGSDEVIDHFLVGPTGAYAIDSEEWDKRLPVRTKNARQLWHGPFSQKDRLEHARWEAARASELLGETLGEMIEVRPAMAVYGPTIPWGVATIRDVDVFSGGNLRKYLRKRPFGGKRPPQILTASDIERIYAAAQRVLPSKY